MDGDGTRRDALRTMARGTLVIFVAIVAFVMATLLGTKLGKFAAAVGMVGLCVGVSIILNGAIDWWRE